MVIPTTIAIPNDYATHWTCYANFGKGLPWALLLPIAALASISLIVTEAGGMMHRTDHPPFVSNKSQMGSAM